MTDIWRIDQRGKSLALASFAPMLGAAVGPIVGGAVSQSIGWPWIFWIVSIFDAILLILYMAFVPESYGPTILGKKASKLRKASGRNYETEFERSHTTLSNKLWVSFVRPLKLLVTRPIIQFTSLLIAFNFGTYCIALSTFSRIWTERYHESDITGGLQYIGIALGSIIATIVGGPITDHVWQYLKTKNDGRVVPEYRIPMMIPGSLLMPIGLVMYGWCAKKKALWIAVDIGAGLFSGGVVMTSAAIYSYIFDEFEEHSASSNAATRMLSNILGFVFPIFAPQLYVRFGYGWGNSLLAIVYIVMAWPTPFILWKWGPRIRGVGRIH